MYANIILSESQTGYSVLFIVTYIQSFTVKAAKLNRRKEGVLLNSLVYGT